MTCRTLIFLFIACICLSCTRPSHEGRSVLAFDEGWLFHRGDVQGAQEAGFFDTGWRKINVPHDWSIEDIPGTDSPFDSTVVNGVSSGFTCGGTGWYRKHFTLDQDITGNKVFIRFDGVYMNADVWVNSHHAGNHFYGYTPFEYEISRWLHPGADNVIAVRIVNDSVRCRWYSGSGIYRQVKLITTPGFHITSHGIAVTTPQVTEKEATVEVNTTVLNQSGKKETALLTVKILDNDNHTVAEGSHSFSLLADAEITLKNGLSVQSPRLWSPENPDMYSVVCELRIGSMLIDRDSQNFGIRSIKFDSKQGFLLNGKEVNLKGGCIHHDNGPLGTAAIARAEERKIELLKAAGFNAVRMAHNPPSEAMLDACDRLGMLVIDEAFDVWRYGHFSGDYATKFDSLWPSDLRSMVLRDRNHPSVIMWSIGNEIRNSGTPEIDSLCGVLADFVRSVDPSRPVTAAQNAVSIQKDNFFSHLDVCGYNYARTAYKTDHARKPERVIFCSESYPSEAYDYWQAVTENAWLIGDFVWTAFDYMGEASIGWRGYPQNPDFYPWNLAYCGDIDICGNARPQSLYRQTLWNDKPVVHLFTAPPEPSFPLNPHKEKWSVWDWPDVIDSWNFEGYENKKIVVSAYTNCDEAELFLNGRPLGKKINRPADKNTLKWAVPFEAGELKVVAYRDGKVAGSSSLRTAGKPAQLILHADRQILKADGQDLCYVTVEIVDSTGTRNPQAENMLTFSASGAGRIIAAANANPMSTESFQQQKRKAWRGKCLVILQAGNDKGTMRLTVHSEGLPDAEITVKTE